MNNKKQYYMKWRSLFSEVCLPQAFQYFMYFTISLNYLWFKNHYNDNFKLNKSTNKVI